MARSLCASALVLTCMAAGLAAPSGAGATTGPDFYTRAVAWDSFDPICDTGESSSTTSSCAQTSIVSNPVFRIEGDASATAGLAKGVLDASTTTSGAYTFGQVGRAQASSTLFDTLTFHGPTGSGGKLVITMSATVAESPGFVGGDQGDVFGDSEGSIGLAVNDSFGHSIGIVNDCEPNFFGSTDCTALNSLGATINNVGQSYSIVASVDVAPGTVLQFLFGAAAVASGDGSASVTDPISLSLPAGMSYTSASGKFLTGAVPEPAAWLELICGAALGGVLLRGRRRRVFA